jgi:hypothetical protein
MYGYEDVCLQRECVCLYVCSCACSCVKFVSECARVYVYVRSVRSVWSVRGQRVMLVGVTTRMKRLAKRTYVHH